MTFFLSKIPAILILTAGTLLLFGCALKPQTHQDQEGGIVGSGNEINCQQQPKDEKCGQKIP